MFVHAIRLGFVPGLFTMGGLRALRVRNLRDHTAAWMALKHLDGEAEHDQATLRGGMLISRLRITGVELQTGCGAVRIS